MATLESEGYAVTAASDGAQALKLFPQETFDLVILDPRSGALRGLQPLGFDERELAGFDRYRNHSGLIPTVAGEMLLCPTGSDFVTAYDPVRWRLMWRFRFRPRIESGNPRQVNPFVQQ